MRLTELCLFQCGENEQFAFSVDKTGCNIPCAPCKGGWVLRGHLKPTELMENYGDAIQATTELEVEAHEYIMYVHGPRGAS